MGGGSGVGGGICIRTGLENGNPKDNRKERELKGQKVEQNTGQVEVEENRRFGLGNTVGISEEGVHVCMEVDERSTNEEMLVVRILLLFFLLRASWKEMYQRAISNLYRTSEREARNFCIWDL